MAEDTGKLKGFCFVSYEDAESAEKAVKELDGKCFIYIFGICIKLLFNEGIRQWLKMKYIFNDYV